MIDRFVRGLRAGALDLDIPERHRADALLLRAAARGRLGRFHDAQTDRRGALAAGADPLEAATLGWALHEVDAALEELRAIGTDIALRLRADLAGRAGLDPEALETMRELLERYPGDPELHRRAAELCLHARHWEAARVHLDALAHPPLSDLARVLLELGDLEAARAHALVLGDPHLLIELGELERAKALSSGELTARLALWAGQVLPGAPEWIQHAGALLAGADAPIDEGVDDPEILAWAAQRRLRRGERAAGRALADRAMAMTPRFHFPAVLLRLTDEMEEDLARVHAGELLRDQTQRTGPLQLATEVRGSLAALWERDRVSEQASLADLVALFHESLARLSGNRSPTTTYVEGGQLRLLCATPTPRQASRWALELIRVAPPAQVLEAFSRLLHRFPDSESPLAHRGELYLWLGDYDSAARDFDAALALQPGTRWAHIGLAAAAMLAGDPEKSLALHERGVATMGGAIGSVFIYRGEALARLGRYEEARIDLERAMQASPTRIAAWLDLALVARALGEDAARYDDLLCAHAPMLLEDAGGAAPFEAGCSQSVLLRAREMMRGNRSSSCQTYLARGRLRLVPRPRLDRPGEHDAARRKVLVGVTRRIEQRVLGSRPGNG